MAISLGKGGNALLSGAVPGLRRVLVGLGWNARSTLGDAFDLDASAFLLAASGKVTSDSDFVFYNQTKSADGSVEHAGDNRTGDGEGDDEVVKIDLSKVAPGVAKIAITVTIHDAAARRQNFGMVSGAFIRVVDEATGTEIVRYDLSEDFSVETALVFGEIYRHESGWKFRAVGQGFQGGLEALVVHFGVSL
jgi:tellurium resistance protein TerD